MIRASSTCRDWMRSHGVRFQPPLSGALHVARTNAFFMGGGKALVNAYYRSAEQLGVADPLRRAGATPSNCDGDRFVAARTGTASASRRKSCVLAAGGFESNREWLREAWGQNERGEWPADNFLIRGTRFNQGVLLKHMIDAGADTIGDPSQSHCVAIDARAPLYDGGICTRIDCVSLGVVVNREAQRFYDEGEDFWPKRYAIWGRLVAQQPGQIGTRSSTARRSGASCRRCFLARRPTRWRNSRASSASTRPPSCRPSSDFNAACRVGTLRPHRAGRLPYRGLAPAKTHWARPIDTPPFYAYPLRPGITFTYLGLKVDETAAVHFGGAPSPNLFVAGEMMAGNVLGQGYTAGVGMSIGTAFGRIAGDAGGAPRRHAAARGAAMQQLEL